MLSHLQCKIRNNLLNMQMWTNRSQGNRIKIPPSFCIRQCGEDIFTTIITAGGNKWGIVCEKSRIKPLEELHISLIFSNFNT